MPSNIFDLPFMPAAPTLLQPTTAQRRRLAAQRQAPVPRIAAQPMVAGGQTGASPLQQLAQEGNQCAQKGSGELHFVCRSRGEASAASSVGETASEEVWLLPSGTVCVDRRRIR